MKSFLTITLILIACATRAQFYAGFNGGTYERRPAVGVVIGVKQDWFRLQMTQTVPLTMSKGVPVLHNFTAGIGERIGLYGGAAHAMTSGDGSGFWKFSGGVSYYRNTWFARAGILNKQFSIQFACSKLFD